MMPPRTLSAEAAAEFSPAPLLDAFENFQGSFFDLDRGLRISAGELKKLKAEVCEEMKKNGVSAADRVLSAVPNGPLFAAVWAASLEIGACPVLVHGDTPAPDLERMAVCWGLHFVIAEAGNLAGSHSVTDTRYGTLHWQRIEREPRGQIDLVSVPLHPTSGTSGGPKIAVRPGPCAVAEPQHYIETLSIEKSDVILCTTPMSHAYAYGMCFMVALLTSAGLLFMRRFNPDLLKNTLQTKAVSILPAVPVTLDTLLAEDAATRIGRPRIVLSAGAPLTTSTFGAFRDRFGLLIRPLYGTTETGGISIGLAEEESDGSVGPPLHGVEVDLHSLAGEQPGSDTKVLRVRSSSMMAGYLEDGQINRGLLPDGWFNTGDLARLDENGRIHLQGRLSEIINAFGLKVLPREVEQVIALLPEVAEVKVYGSHWRGQEVVEAAVVRRGQIREEQILAHCDCHLVHYKCPTVIRFVEALPRTASGKVAVDRLLERS